MIKIVDLNQKSSPQNLTESEASNITGGLSFIGAGFEGAPSPPPPDLSDSRIDVEISRFILAKKSAANQQLSVLNAFRQLSMSIQEAILG